MGSMIFCAKCGGLKEVESEPYESVSTASLSWSGKWCDCPEEERPRVRFCPYCGSPIGIKGEEGGQ